MAPPRTEGPETLSSSVKASPLKPLRGGWDKEPARACEARWPTGGKSGEHRERRQENDT